jgi:hypothetical protein
LWKSALLVEEAGGFEENHEPATSKLHMSLVEMLIDDGDG